MIRHTNFHRAAPATPDPKERWQDQGVCSSPEFAADRDLWFAVERDKEAIHSAQLICDECPVKTECADWALTNRTQFGIWGGLTERQRRSILRQRAKQAAQVEQPAKEAPKPKPAKRQTPACGTRGGYQRHLRLKEPVDDACRKANTEADNRLRNTGTTKRSAA